MARKRAKANRARKRRHTPSIHEGGDRDEVASRGSDREEPRPEVITEPQVGGMFSEFKRGLMSELREGEPAEPEIRPRDGRERPQPLWGSFPLSEIAIAIGVIVAIGGFANEAQVALLAGIGICVVSVGEVTLREHLSGYRSHSALIGLLAVAVFEAAAYELSGRNWVGLLAGVSGAVVFVVVTWAMHRWFQRIRTRDPLSV